MFKSVKTAVLLSMLPLSGLSVSAFAAPITLQATFDSQYNKYTGIGLLTLTYDDATPADSISASSAPVATYLNAITAATFVFDNLSLTLNHAATNQIQVINNHGFGSSTDANFFVSFLDTSNAEYKIGFFIVDPTADHANNDTNLSNINGLRDSEGAMYLYAADEPTPYASSSHNNIRQLTPMAPVPLPASLWMFGSGLLGLTGLSKRRK